MPQRSLSAELLDAIITGKPSLQVFLKITLPDNTETGFTKFPVPFPYDGVTYLPGLDVTVVSSSIGFSVDNLEVSGFYKEGVLSELDVASGKYDSSRYELFALDYEDLSAGIETIQRGRVREIRSEDNQFTVVLNSTGHLLQANVGVMCKPTCQVKKMGDAQCSIDLVSGSHPVSGLAYKWTGASVASVTNHLLFTVAVSAGSYPSEFFQNGELLWLSGDNTGVKSEVKQFINNLDGTGAFLIQEPPRRAAILAGDTFRVYAGCNRTYARCDYYQNVVNMRKAYPFLIGQRKSLIAK